MLVDKFIFRNTNKLKSYKLQASKAFSLAEAILAIALFGILASVLVSLALNSVNAIGLSQEESEASYLVDRVLGEMKQAVASSGWQYWETAGNVNKEYADSKFHSNIIFTNVCRDITNTIVQCPAGTVDNNTKYIVATVSWTDSYSREHQVKREVYLIK